MLLHQLSVLLFLSTKVLLRIQFMSPCISPRKLSRCMPLLIHNVMLMSYFDDKEIQIFAPLDKIFY